MSASSHGRWTPWNGHTTRHGCCPPGSPPTSAATHHLPRPPPATSEACTGSPATTAVTRHGRHMPWSQHRNSCCPPRPPTDAAVPRHDRCRSRPPTDTGKTPTGHHGCLARPSGPCPIKSPARNVHQPIQPPPSTVVACPPGWRQGWRPGARRPLRWPLIALLSCLVMHGKQTLGCYSLSAWLTLWTSTYIVYRN